MEPHLALTEQEFTAQTEALVSAWGENLAHTEPNRQRLFSDYHALSSAFQYLERRLGSPRQRSAEPSALRALHERVAACLDFSTLGRAQAAALKKYLFAGRSRGCHSSPSANESELMQSIEERAQGEG